MRRRPPTDGSTATTPRVATAKAARRSSTDRHRRRADAADNPIGPQKVRTVVVTPGRNDRQQRSGRRRRDRRGNARTRPTAPPALRAGRRCGRSRPARQWTQSSKAATSPVDHRSAIDRAGRSQGRSGGRRRRRGRRPRPTPKPTADGCSAEAGHRRPRLRRRAAKAVAAAAKPAAPPGRRRRTGRRRPTADAPRRQRRWTDAAAAKPAAADGRGGRRRRPRPGVVAELGRSGALDLSATCRQRFPSILGRYQREHPARRSRATAASFYRVRVGPFGGSDAQRLCDDLKAAGGDCILAR